ncbi:unnamed protein product [Paramecium pentaurelia]|uniref:Uncharacterized protein n=1 Tax=Paramecium pentaurelia TaxID=43138 RepID=A0A8S1V7V7_9CILI|nr:unnamed protein product [Paramecium pentaurelia]
MHYPIWKSKMNPSVHQADMQFYSTRNSPISMSIQGKNVLNVNFLNITIFNITFDNQVLFNIVCTDQSDYIIINNFHVKNCLFTNSTLFQFQNARRRIQIENLIIDSCEFYNSSIVRLNQVQNLLTNIIINSMSIKDSIFNNINLINSIEKTILTINNIQIMSNQLINSKFIIFNYKFYCNDIFMKDNQLISSQFISQISSLLLSSEIQMNNIKIRKNIIQHFSLFATEQKQSTSQVTYLLENLYFEDNTLSCYQEQFLITINCHSLVIQNIFLRNTTNYRFISLLAVPFIRIQNAIYENLHQAQKVQTSSNCFSHCFSHSQLLQVSGFSNISLNQITIKNQFSIDQSIISIQSNPLITLNSNDYIQITNVEFMGNMLLKQNLGIFFLQF